MIEKYEINSEVFYTKEHTWAKPITDKTVKVGITDYAQKQLREVIFVELPNIGGEVEQMKTAGSLESVKAVSDFYSPVSGTVKRVNRELISNPSLVNSDPYGNGWMLVIHSDNLKEELRDLLEAENYKKLLKRLEK